METQNKRRKMKQHLINFAYWLLKICKAEAISKHVIINQENYKLDRVMLSTTISQAQLNTSFDPLLLVYHTISQLRNRLAHDLADKITVVREDDPATRNIIYRAEIMIGVKQ